MLYDLIEMVLGGSMRCVITILTKWFSSTRAGFDVVGSWGRLRVEVPEAS
jgi:hypothetical protein